MHMSLHIVPFFIKTLSSNTLVFQFTLRYLSKLSTFMSI